MFFDLLHSDKHARAGIIHTDHGDIETPVFMPVGTQASVKTLDQTDLVDIGAQIILGNNYHLHLRPGEDLIAEAGGLHKFMNWNKPILTDSGGFQVFSLGLQKSKKAIKPESVADTRPHPALPLKGEEATIPSFQGGETGVVSPSQARLVKIDEDGVTFTSHIDGSTHRFTPEGAIEMQNKIGADIIMAFDECTPDDAPLEYAREAMERTHRWAKRSLETHKHLNTATLVSDKQEIKKSRNQKINNVATNKLINQSTNNSFIFGIIQGAGHKELREESAKYISSLDFDGIAIGGESIGYNMKATAEIMDWVYPIIPDDKPHYTMGVGLSPVDLLIAVEHGADMFDCVAPTRIARHGMVYVSNPRNPRLNLYKSDNKKDFRPIDESCACSTCQNYTRSYLHHLFAAEEMSAMRLCSIHNLFFMINLMQEAREAILQNKFLELKKRWM